MKSCAVILGFARQGRALAHFLAQAGLSVRVTDNRSAESLADAIHSLQGLPVHFTLGESPESLLDGADTLYVSGGVPVEHPLIVAAQARRIRVTNDSQLFLERTPCPTLGITGSAGKTTTTTLTHLLMQAAFPTRKVWVGGNIGNPLIADLPAMQGSDFAVMELSSFQLEWMTASPQVAAVLNITPNHLDRHGTMSAYTAAKARILQFQSAQDTAVLGWQDAVAKSLAQEVRGRLFAFSSQPADFAEGVFCQEGWLWLRIGNTVERLIPRELIQLPGEHNLRNVAAASALCAAAGLSAHELSRVLQQVLPNFHGVAHRLEWVQILQGVRFVNDSIATAPERTLAALPCFDQPLVLLLGGRDKKLPWLELAQALLQRASHGKLRAIVLFGEAADLIADVFKQAGLHAHCQVVKEFAPAVRQAARLAQTGDVVLLSPGCTSYDQFVDFEARGVAFRQLVQELARAV
ncbi:MAG TPA: UDP-N-acetylmuramoyl-L-alanine--D-glutamate ligase [Anaerolineales bacterium]|nr:UDP-N-acetylmuramoyl-L-alanine--D-glutamate ligase [Anaerolineales bacterium]